MKKIGILIGFVGVSVLTLAAYKVVDPFASSRQAASADSLSRVWADTPDEVVAPEVKAPKPKVTTEPKAKSASEAKPPAGDKYIETETGQPFAVITVPRLGSDWRFTVVEGTNDQELKVGIGHVSGTGLPSDMYGNFVVAGHVLTAGNPFLHLKTMQKGDAVFIRTKNYVYKYSVFSAPFRVDEQDVSILNFQKAHPRMATLITCDPAVLWHTPWRMIVWADLVSVIRV